MIPPSLFAMDTIKSIEIMPAFDEKWVIEKMTRLIPKLKISPRICIKPSHYIKVLVEH